MCHYHHGSLQRKTDEGPKAVAKNKDVSCCVSRIRFLLISHSLFDGILEFKSLVIKVISFCSLHCF